MKKFLSLFLAMTMVLSLCACSGKTNPPTADSSGVTNVSSSAPLDGTENVSDVPDAPKKVTGDRVILSEEDLKAKFMPTDFVIGPVDHDTIVTSDRLPLDDQNMKMSVGVEVEGGGIMKMTIIQKEDNQVFEIETAKDDFRMLTRYFEQDGEVYMYIQGSEDNISAGQIYRLIDEAGDTEVDPDDGEEVPIEVDDNTAEPSEGSDSEGVDLGEMMDGFTAEDGLFGGIKAGSMDEGTYTSMEYVGLIGDNHTFEAVDKEGNEFILLIDKISGWIVGVNQTNETEEYKSMSVRIDYNVEEIEKYDVSNAQDMNSFEAIMTLFAQFMVLGDFDAFGEVD